MMTLLEQVKELVQRSDAAATFLSERDAKRLQEHMRLFTLSPAEPGRAASLFNRPVLVSKVLDRSYVVIASPDGPLCYAVG